MRLGTILLPCMVALASPALAKGKDPRETRLIELAHYCLVSDLIMSKVDPRGEKSNASTCRAAELGLAFIGEASTRRGEEELAGLRRYVLDGVVGESYSCYVLSKDERVLAILNVLDFDEQRKICEEELAHRLKDLRVGSDAINSDAVCIAPSKAKQWVKQIAAAAKAHRTCNEEDW